jgi:23S rRNA (uracil1939-C5)-methyltransferase
MKRVLDLYAGAGNLSLSLSQSADITAVESNPYAVNDGLRNIEINNISNYRIIKSSTEKFDTDEKFDTIILDPPRPGVSQKVIKLIQKIMPEMIVYVSCNPATLSRDIKRLSELYEIESVRLIDLFPHTHHIETLTFMRRRSS